MARVDNSDGEAEAQYQGDQEAAAVLQAQSDPHAFADLYLLYRDRVYLYLLRRTGSAEDASDLAQEVFLRVFRSIRRYEPARGPFASWIFAIARNTHRSFFMRRRLGIAWDVSPEEVEGSSCSSQDPQTPTGLERLKYLLSRLTPKEQELIHLRFEIDLTIPQIAAVLGMSDEAAKKAMQRTLRKLKDTYQDDL